MARAQRRASREAAGVHPDASVRGISARICGRARRRGAKGKIAEDFALILKLLDGTGGNVEQARARFIVEQAGSRFVVKPPQARLTVRSTRKDLTFQQSGKRVIDLTPQVRSVFSKRFTRAMKEIHKLASNKSDQ